MNGKQLKNSILQWAIQGKLVPQDPSDEPASVLLEKIRAEKARLVKEKKIKKDKNESIIFRSDDNSYYEKFLATGEVKCIDEEIPFEIPEGWEWCRLGNLIQLLSGQDFIPEKYNSKGIGIPYIIGASNISSGKLLINRWTETPSVIGQKDDLLIVCKGSGVGKMCICNVEKIHIARQIQIIRCLSSLIHLSYLKIVIDTNLPNIVSKAQGVIPGISREHVQNLLIPLSSTSEQFRIVKCLDKLIPYISSFAKHQVELEKINNYIRQALKSSILQEAIQGKLVEQVTEEGTAQELLEQIKQEKQRLAKEGKLKKSALNDSIIFRGDDNKYYERIGTKEYDISEEIPFDIPYSWCWCRLSNVISLLSGRDLVPELYNSNHNGIPYITGASNFNDGSLIVNRWTNSPLTISHKNDLLITCKGTIGELAFNQIGDIHIARQIMSLSGIIVELDYIQCYLKAIVPALEKQANSMIPGISRDTLLNAILPLPPKGEQKRIISRVTQLLDILK